MPHNTFYHPHPFESNAKITLSKEESKHLSVMRLQENDHCLLLNGIGEKAEGLIQKIEGTSVSIEILEVEKKEKPLYPFHLALALTKLPKLELVIEKSTELGVSSISLFPGELSQIPALNENKQNRISSLSIAALKQSGGFYLPKIELFSSITKVPLTTQKLYFGSLDEMVDPLPFEKSSITCFIGPEKGFSSKEMEFFKKNKILPARLSSNILRAETAAITSAALAAYFRLSFPE